LEFLCLQIVFLNSIAVFIFLRIHDQAAILLDELLDIAISRVDDSGAFVDNILLSLGFLV
jgi:hypothetical protein